MTKDKLKKFKKIFEAQRSALLFSDKVVREDFNVNVDDRFDEVDQATTDMEQSMRMRLRNRESFYIKKVEEALARIEEGTFGECGECGEDIELRRLEARPTATLCIACKEEQERKEMLNASGREHNSARLSRAATPERTKWAARDGRRRSYSATAAEHSPALVARVFRAVANGDVPLQAAREAVVGGVRVARDGDGLCPLPVLAVASHGVLGRQSTHHERERERDLLNHRIPAFLP
jgi:DnaK suppressor protein